MSDDTGSISDGYHTFDELYEHRHALFIALAKTYKNASWRCPVHDDGTMFPGQFIAGLNLPTGFQVSYHLPLSKWQEMAGVRVVDKPAWDGHSSQDVPGRIQKWSEEL